MEYHDYSKLLSLHSFSHIIKKLFPQNVKNKIPTNLIGLYHLLGASFIIWGLLLPPKYLYIHIFLTCFILFTYYIFSNQCFVTILSDFLCETSTNPLVVPISKVKSIIYFLLALSILFYTYPTLSIYNTVFL